MSEAMMENISEAKHRKAKDLKFDDIDGLILFNDVPVYNKKDDEYFVLKEGFEFDHQMSNYLVGYFDVEEMEYAKTALKNGVISKSSAEYDILSCALEYLESAIAI